MSADNAIVILVTQRRDGKGLEYRVANVQAIEDIDFAPDYPSGPEPVVNRERVRSLFNGVAYFRDEEAAWCYAFKLRELVRYVENGIRRLDYSAIRFPRSERREQRRSRRQALKRPLMKWQQQAPVC